MIRQLPAGFALIIRGGCAPVIARLPRAWNNRAYRRARRAPRPGYACPSPGPALPVTAAPEPEPGIPDHLPDAWTAGDDTPSPFPWS
jgi:hypothetical protein